jgi:ribulose 1,5-bisphosphate carboxylase large subunit-like protein
MTSTSTDRISATYWLETGDDPHRAAEVIAGEQSSGTFVSIPGESLALKERAGARIEALEILGRVASPSLPHSLPGKDYAQCALTLSWPLANIGASLTNLMSTIAGNLFELRQLSGLRITDLQLPEAFVKVYQGPAFGISGTRRLSGVNGGPLIGTIIKPSVGLDADETAAQVRELVAGGIDFIKDDELQADGPSCPFEARVRAVMRVVDEVVARAARACVAPLFANAPMAAVPVFSSAQTGLQALDTYRALGSADLIVTAGGGIFGHPDGTADGVRALRQAWDAAMAGVPLTTHAETYPALKRALMFW